MIKKQNQKTIRKILKKYHKNIDKEYTKELTRLINTYSNKFETLDNLAIFLANLIAEIDTSKKGKVKLRENLNYSPSGLILTFPRHFTIDEALKYGRVSKSLANKINRTKKWKNYKIEKLIKPHKANQIEIANRAYANRLGNGDIKSGDGWRYRGLGSFQITGKDNFNQMFKALKVNYGINLDFLKDHPELTDIVMNNYTMHIMSALAYWIYSNMYRAKTIDESIDIINKYTKSRNKRKRIYKEIKPELKS